LSLEIQDLPDVVRVVVLLSLTGGSALQKTSLKRRVDRILKGQTKVEISDLDKTLEEMATEGLVLNLDDGAVQVTPRGSVLAREWRNVFLKREPILEVVAGLTDGFITALIVILSAVLAGLTVNRAAFAAFLTLASVSITNFSSFFLGGVTEDLADMLSLQNLMNYSLSDIPDKWERDKSLTLVSQLFKVLRGEIDRTNFRAALLSGTTTFLVGAVPITTYLMLPKTVNIVTSLAVIGIGALFLVHYQSKKTRSHWKRTLLQTLVIITIAVVASLLLGGGL
jgi:hypothetical protein